MNKFLDEVQLKAIAPSIFATGGAMKVSDRYGFIPTIEVIRGLDKAGFYPVKAVQAKSRVEDRKEFGKHMIRFRHESNMGLVKEEGLFSEIVLVNSHDGSTSYQLKAGVFRLVCSNGLIVGNECFSRSIKHQGDVISKVVDAANDLIEISPISVEKAVEWKGIDLNIGQRAAFATAALGLKWDKDEGESFPVKPSAILEPRRYQDQATDLWTTFNVIQENLMQGGLRYRTEAGSRMKTRAVNSVNENIRLNTALWTLTEKMAELATA